MWTDKLKFSVLDSDATAEAEELEADLFGWKRKRKQLKGTASASRAKYALSLKNPLKLLKIFQGFSEKYVIFKKFDFQTWMTLCMKILSKFF